MKLLWPEVMRRSKLIRWVFSVGSILVAGILLFVVVWPVPVDTVAPQYISFLFTGLTNDGKGHALALFSVSNVTTFMVNCHAGSQIQVTNRTQSRTNVAWTWQAGSKPMALQPGRSTAVEVLLTNGVPWRFAVHAQRPPGLGQIAAEKLQRQISSEGFRLLYGDLRRSHFLQSRIFGPGESPSLLKTTPNQ